PFHGARHGAATVGAADRDGVRGRALHRGLASRRSGISLLCLSHVSRCGGGDGRSEDTATGEKGRWHARLLPNRRRAAKRRAAPSRHTARAARFTAGGRPPSPFGGPLPRASPTTFGHKKAAKTPPPFSTSPLRSAAACPCPAT